ncbi:VOC family protein [Microbacterium sp. GXF7504]
MTMHTTIHLNFRGQARAALEFYAAAFDAAVAITTYAQLGAPPDALGADGVVFGQAASDDGFRVMAYDTPGARAGGVIGGGATRREQGLTLTDQAAFVAVTGDSLELLRSRWERLTPGATILEPLAPSTWSPGFGMLTDRFGVTWSFSVVPADAAARS